MNVSGLSTPLTTSLRRAPTWLRVALLLGIVHLAWLLSGLQGGQHVRRPFSIGLLTFLGLQLTWALRRAAQRSDLPDTVRSGLRFIAAGMALNGLGGLYLLIEAVLYPGSPAIFSVADAFFLCTYPLILIGLLRLPRSDRPVAGPGRILLDGAVFVVGIGVPLWLFAVQPALRTATGFDALLVVLWPLFAFCGIIVVNAALLTRAPLPSRPAVWLLITGQGVSWLADLVFTLDATSGFIVHGPINWINVTNTVSLCLTLVAAWRFQVDPVAARPKTDPAATSPMPMITILVVASWLVLLAITGRQESVSLEHLLPGLILLFLVLFVRETLMMRDSLRWMAAAAHRESQARFEAMVKNSSDIIMIVDEDRRVRFASPAATTVLGTTPESLVGRDLLELVHPEDAAAGVRLLEDLLRHPGATRHLRWRLHNTDGSFRHLETAGSNLLGETNIAGLVLNSRDVSERFALEERLRHAEKMEAIGRLAGGVAHDFNNLLAVILANSELALLGLSPTHSSRQDIEEVRRATSRGAALTNRLLSLNRSGNLQPRAVAPAEVLTSITPALQRMIAPTLTLRTRIECPAGLVKVNPDALEQALLNLAANARDASPAGSTLTFSVRAAALSRPLASAYLAAPAGQYIVIEAADTGSGMNDATRARLFEPFFTTKERGRGTGLGLAAVYGTVKTAGGGLTVESTTGAGTTIGIWLPEVTPVAPAGPAPSPTTTTSSGAETILLVDDEDLVRSATQRILQFKGYHVLVASHANDARRVLSGHPGPVHLLLTDVMMPGESGPVMASKLVKERPDLRVLYMSGYTGDELGAEGLSRADSRLLVKPFTVEQLTARLREVLAGPAGQS